MEMPAILLWKPENLYNWMIFTKYGMGIMTLGYKLAPCLLISLSQDNIEMQFLYSYNVK
jgi:hypothetical protein